jgi:hypothetical protein
MPDPVVINPLNPPQADAAAHNAEIAARQAAQDAAGHSTAGKPGEFEEASSALDKLAAAVPEKKPDPIIEPAKSPDQSSAKSADELAAEKQAADEAAAKKAADDAAAAAKNETTTPDPLKEVQEPEGASQKARDNWKALRDKAAAEIAARDTKLAEAQKKLAEFEERTKNPTPEQLQKEKELEELRLFRAKLDVEFDPAFKKFDTQVAQNEAFIYAQLMKSPAVGADVIEQIKKYGGPDKCNLSKLFESIADPTLQRIVESKIAENAQIRYQKDQALSVTKQNMESYLKEKEKSYIDAATQHTTVTQGELTKYLGALEWAKPKEVTGDDAAKAAATEHNKWLEKVQAEVNQGLQDDSPQMRAVLLTSYANMCRLQRDNASMTTELAALKKEHADLSAKWTAVKKAGTSRLRESGAPPGGALPQAKPANQFTTPATESLDNLMKTVMEERAAKGQ